MAQLLVRNLDEKVIARLKKKARAEGRSLQSEAKMILAEAAGVEPADMAELLKELEKFRRRFQGRKFSDSAALIREDRER